MELALIGLQFAGKSAVFDLLAATVGAEPSERTGLRRLSLKLPDSRLDALAALLKPEKVTPMTISLVDPPPRGEEESRSRTGRSDPFAAVREADGLILVIRAFDAPDVPHPAGSVDPHRDMRAMRSELMLADLVVLDGRLEKIGRMKKVGKPPDSPLEGSLLERCRESLEAEKPLSDLELNADELRLLSGFSLMTTKPCLAVLNVGERPAGAAGEAGDREAVLAEFRGAFADTRAIALCASLELELAGLTPEEAREFMEAEGIERLGGIRILELLPELCGRITFFTVIRNEVRAWSLPRGSTASQAAGTVHTDMEKGFIKAEVISWRDLVDCGSVAAAREKGLLRLEGRDYAVQDGDVITVRFSA